jgi:hypothetical protein
MFHLVASDTPVTDGLSLKQRWKHLSDLPVTATGGRVDILIGTDLSHLVAGDPYPSHHEG